MRNRQRVDRKQTNRQTKNPDPINIVFLISSCFPVTPAVRVQGFIRLNE